MGMPEQDADRVRRACRDLLLKLAWLTDHGPHHEIPTLFSEDGELIRDGKPTRGRDALREMYAKRPPELMTRHLISNLVIEPLSDSLAVARSSATVYRVRSPGGTKPVPPMTCGGPESILDYDDRLERLPEGWRLSRRVLSTVIHVRP
jgi:SnoaL-like domain